MFEHDLAAGDPLGRNQAHILAYGEVDRAEQAEQLRRVILEDFSVLRQMDRDGRTPLDAARLVVPNPTAKDPIIDVLREYGAPPAAAISHTANLMSHADAGAIVQAWQEEMNQGRFGTEAAAWASQSNRFDVLAFVAPLNKDQIQQDDLNRWLREACSQSRSVVADALLTLGANPNQPGKTEGSTLLHDAARVGHQGMIFALASHGAAVNVQDPSGSTPLLLAVRSRNPAAVMALLRANADPSIQDNDKFDAKAVADQVRLMPPLASLISRTQADRARQGGVAQPQAVKNRSMEISR